MANFIEPIVDEKFCVWVAPDGTPQLSTLAADAVMCVAFTNLLHSQGIGLSPHEMKLKGFSMERVRLTIVPDKNPEAQA